MSHQKALVKALRKTGTVTAERNYPDTDWLYIFKGLLVLIISVEGKTTRLTVQSTDDFVPVRYFDHDEEYDFDKYVTRFYEVFGINDLLKQ